MQKQSKKQMTLEEFQLTSYLSGANAAYIEELYEVYLKNPNEVDDQWRAYFDSLANHEASAVADISHEQIRTAFREMAKRPVMATLPAQTAAPQGQELVDQLIMAYRRFGHLNAKLDPLGTSPTFDERLTLEHYGLTQANLDETFNTRHLLPQPQAKLSKILKTLQSIYSHHVGIEYSRISNEREREWLRDYVEHRIFEKELDVQTKRNILHQLTVAEGLEKYLDVKYPGQKRFSIEGGDSLIPLLDELAKRSRQVNIHEMVIGMAHRGRLNVLMNIMGQSPVELFQEFEGTQEYGLTSGDVKYHRGFSSDVKTDAGPMHLSLAFNPSHLEFICPVVMGSVRARQERNHKDIGSKQNYAMAVMIHGDAAFAGQGVVMETLNMSLTRAYHIGGSIHIILNNQIGYTTSNPKDARSSHYCSDLAKMIDAPVFHVNSDDPEAVVKITQLALDYRMEFNKDVVIDLVCYRRHGHQEVDEPRATQPLMYRKIRNHPTTRALYAEKLSQEGMCTEEEIKAMISDCRTCLDEGRQICETLRNGLSEHYAANWTKFYDRAPDEKADTSVPKKKLINLAKKIEALPEGFTLQRNVKMIMNARKEMTEGKRPIDWGYAEILAYATLLEEGYPIRFSGEDVRRGTFFHRHATLFDQNTGKPYMPLLQLGEEKTKLQIYDSLLSEVGALGFEYGYSTADPQALVIWEAQFGDFANGAQVIIDQFISSAWQKWKRLSGLTMLLPHGYEAMGPEHSSARLERYLQLCAQDNIQVFVPSTPAQIFHLLRRQVLRPYRKPLIIMSPKSLLRHKLAVSSLEDLSKGQLQLLIPEVDSLDSEQVTRVVLCSGKVYYELLEKRRNEGLEHIAIVRIEQLYPFPYDELKAILVSYPNAKDIVWCQEEPKNQGAWFCTQDRLKKCLPEGRTVRYVGRHSMAAPAGGYPSLHKKLQGGLLSEALAK